MFLTLTVARSILYKIYMHMADSNERKRLNPKLTKRCYVPVPPTEAPPVDTQVGDVIDEKLVRSIKFTKSSEGGPQISSVEKDSVSLNMHDGEWVPKVFDNVGKYRSGGYWSCCGDPNQLSEECGTGPDARPHEDEMKELLPQESEAARKRREELKEMLKQPKVVGNAGNDGDEKENALTKQHDFCNAPMLISWIYKNITDEYTVSGGLSLMLENVQSGPGCENMVQYDCTRCIVKAHLQFPKNVHVQLACVSVLRKLLDCNITRPSLLSNPKPLKLLFTVSHQYMSSQAHVEQCVQGILQYSREEAMRSEIMAANMIHYVILYCRMYWRVPRILRSALKLFNWVTDIQERMEAVYHAGAVRTTLKVMERHLSNPDVLAPGMHFLTRAAAAYSPASMYMIKKEAIPVVIGALKALYSSERLQLEGLKMLQALSRYEDGWRQISQTKGGWQVICQGTIIGDSLVHELQGDFHNPGWAIGDTPHLPLTEQSKLAAAKVNASLRQESSSSSWSLNQLRAYMGLGTAAQTLAINREFQEAHFELLCTLELLPYPKEEREDWYKRLSEFEKLNELTLEEMSRTILSLKKKEAKEAQLAASRAQDEEEEYIKPVFVMGKRITTKLLEENDLDAANELKGIV